MRRLSGVKVETSAVFNMTTQFGGGKTHALTLLYHLAQGGAEAGMLAYVVKESSGKYEPFVYRQALREADLEVTDDVFLISKDDAETYIARQASGDAEDPAAAPSGATPVPVRSRAPAVSRGEPRPHPRSVAPRTPCEASAGPARSRPRSG